MIGYVKNIKNPALKCFIHVLPFFIGFFILKDFGSEIWSSMAIFFNTITKSLSPIFRFGGEYIMGLIAFISVWSIYVYFCLLKTEKDRDIINTWKSISHIITVFLFFYGSLYISDTLNLMGELKANYKHNGSLNYFINLISSIGLVCFLSIVANIYLIGSMRTFNNEIKEKESYR